jgi:hypothetical protein
VIELPIVQHDLLLFLEIRFAVEQEGAGAAPIFSDAKAAGSGDMVLTSVGSTQLFWSEWICSM